MYNQVIRTAKKLHFERQLAENQKNLRKTWQILFFTSIARKTVENVNPSSKSPTDLITQNPNFFKLSDSSLTKTEILNATKLLANKKTPDHTGVSSNFIKQTISSLIDPRHHIFNLSFNSGVVPIQFKIAKVIPIFKSGDRTSMDNYRPISLLSTFSKILEKLVATRLTSFLTEKQYLKQMAIWFPT